MTTNEEKVLKIIKSFKGKANSLQIAKELRISLGYADLLLRSLQRKGKIEFSGRWVSLVEKEVPAPVTVNKPKKRAKKRKKKVKKSKKRKKTEESLMKLQGMTEDLEKNLQKAGYKNVRVLAEASVARLMEDTGVKLKQAASLINEARKISKIIPNTTPKKEKRKPEEKKKQKPKKTTTHPPPSRKRAPKRGKKKEKKRKKENKLLWPIKVLKRFFG